MIVIKKGTGVHGSFFERGYVWRREGNLFSGGKSVLAEAAYGANPIFRDIFPRGAGSDAAVGIAKSGVIDVSARAFVLRHSEDPPFIIQLVSFCLVFQGRCFVPVTIVSTASGKLKHLF